MSPPSLVNATIQGPSPRPVRTARDLTAKPRVEDEDDDEYENDLRAVLTAAFSLVPGLPDIASRSFDDGAESGDPGVPNPHE